MHLFFHPQEIFTTFGIPFFIKLKNGESFNKVREKIQKQLEISDKEFEKVSIFVILFVRDLFKSEKLYCTYNI